MRPSESMFGRTAAISAVLLLSASCGSSLERRGARTTAPAETAKVGEGLLSQLPSPTAKPRTEEQRPLFVLRLDDQNDLHPEGIPVRVEGPQQRTVFTDANGEVKIFEPPGVYQFRVVEGCHEHVQVLGGGYATVGVPPDSTKAGSLPVNWRHRIAPWVPVVANTVGDWRVGSQVDLRFDVVNRCADDARAPGASFPTFVFRPGPTLELVGEPSLTADGDGRGKVAVRCTSEGSAQLLAQDSKNPSESFDLVGATLGFGPTPRCVA